MPPSTWMQSLALAFAASMPMAAATAAAMDSCRSSASPTALAASAAATEACSERSSISAHMCLMAWKLPIGLPNCSRTFAYSVAVSSVQRASPAASAASTVAARSSTRCGDADSDRRRARRPARTRASGREKSVALQQLDRHAVGGGVDQHDSVAGGQQQHPGGVGAEHVLGGAGHPAAVEPQIGRQRDARGALARCQRLEQLGVGRPPAWPAPSSRPVPGTRAAAASSTIAHRSSTVPPAPPCSSATATPKIPSSASPA